MLRSWYTEIAVRLWAIIWFAASVASAEEVLTERAERHALRDKAVALLEQNDFAALDELAGTLRSSHARFEDGSWRLAYFYESLDSLTERFNTEAWKELFVRLQRWCDTRPDSVTARIVLANARMSHHDLAEAERMLEQARQLPAKDPELHHARLRLGTMRGWDRAKFEQAYREAVEFEPGYHPYYVEKAGYLRAAVGPRVVEQFAAEAVDDELYTRTLMWLLWSERDEFFGKYGASWARMKRGFEEMQREHPTSTWIANNFCMFACMADDAAAARTQFERIGHDWNPYVWRNEGLFEKWRDWAQGHADRPAKAERPKSLSRPYTGGPILDREALMEQVANLLLAENYDALEEMGQQFRASKERLPEGLWKLQFYYMGLSAPPKKKAGGEEWTYWLELLEKWKQARPNSSAAPIALAGAHVGHAWAGRGGQYASRVTPEGWQMFRERVARARLVLEQSEAGAAVDPHWYAVMMRVAMAQSWKASERQALFERAIQREPAYHLLYFERAMQLLPRWFGHAGDVEEFALRYGDAEGLYARIAWSVQPTAANETFFEIYKFDWPRMRDSFRPIADSNWNLNFFCWFACQAGDKATARELFERLGDRWAPECWKTEQRWRQWRKWAGSADGPEQP